MAKCLFAAMGFGLMMCGVAGAQAPAGAPAGANGICKDGTYSTAAVKSGACGGHKGVQTWYAAAPAKAAPSTGAAAPAKVTTMPAPSPAPAVASRPAPTPAAATPAAMPATAASGGAAKKGPAGAAASRTQAAGGGPGLVWVNTESNVYHCNGDTYYGKTKAGAYMSEADAKAKGAHGDHGKVCTGK